MFCLEILILRAKERFLDFLTMESNILEDKTCEINLIFSGDVVIKIKAEVIEITLDDQGSSWETKNKPKHNFYSIAICICVIKIN